MQEFLDTFFNTFHDFKSFLRVYGYFAILLLTFLEGETIVVLAGVAAAQGLMNPLLVGTCSFIGSFFGDQLYYTIGKYYGRSLIVRWPHLQLKIEWAFKLVRKYQNLYILLFRFIYGVRNISPFVIAISGVSWPRFLSLNIIAALLWATIFTSSGYFFGYAVEQLLSKYRVLMPLLLLFLAFFISAIIIIYRKVKKKNLSVQQNNTH